MTATKVRAEFRKYSHCGREHIPIELATLMSVLEYATISNTVREELFRYVTRVLQERGFEPEDEEQNED